MAQWLVTVQFRDAMSEGLFILSILVTLSHRFNYHAAL